MEGRKTGGRLPGVPNRITGAVKEILRNKISDYYNSEQFNEDIEALTPNERLIAYERLTNYVVPKMQSTAVDLSSDSGISISIGEKLAELAADNDV